MLNFPDGMNKVFELNSIEWIGTLELELDGEKL